MQLTQNRTDRGQKAQTPKSLTGCIRAGWTNLSDEEISYLSRDPQRFYEAVHRKYGLTRDQAETQLHKWEREVREAA